MNLPTPEQCLNLFQDYQVPSHIREHCLNVRDLSLFLAQKLKEKGVSINLQLVECLALLHDLFKMVSLESLKPTKFHSFVFSPEEASMWQQLRERFPGLHEGEVAYQIFKEDYPELALALKSLSQPQENKSWEEALVHYADWRVFQNIVVTLDHRLAYLKEAYPQKDGAWQEDEKIVKLIEKKIFNHLDFEPTKLSEEFKNHG